MAARVYEQAVEQEPKVTAARLRERVQAAVGDGTAQAGLAERIKEGRAQPKPISYDFAWARVRAFAHEHWLDLPAAGGRCGAVSAEQRLSAHKGARTRH
jgi:hypothetical protein